MFVIDEFACLGGRESLTFLSECSCVLLRAGRDQQLNWTGRL